MNRNRRAITWAILLAAFCLRLVTLNTRPVWYDEAFTVFLAEKSYSAIASGTAADTMPPLYYALLHFWIPLVGETPFALRMLSVMLSMLVVALMYAIATRGFGAPAGGWAAFFTALAPFQMYHAQEIRMYLILALGSLIFFYGTFRTQFPLPNHQSLISNTLIALGTALALYSHNLAFLTLIAANVYFLLRRDWRALFNLVSAQTVGAALFIPWLLYVPGQLAKIQRAFWTQPPGLTDVLQMLVVFTTYLPLPMPILALALFITLAIVTLVVFELYQASRRGAPGGLAFVLAFALVPPVLMFALSYLMRSVFVPRGVIASSLAYYVLLAMFAARVPRVGKSVIMATAFVVALIALPFYYTAWGEWRRAPFAEADRFLRARMQSNDLILHDNKLSFFPMRFYDRALPQEFLADPPGSGSDTLARGSQEALILFPIEFDAVGRGYRRVWFVIFQTALDEAGQEGRAHGNLARLDATMQRGAITAFGDLRIYRYEVR